jgi:hypothetical protein
VCLQPRIEVLTLTSIPTALNPASAAAITTRPSPDPRSMNLGLQPELELELELDAFDVDGDTFRNVETFCDI